VTIAILSWQRKWTAAPRRQISFKHDSLSGMACVRRLMADVDLTTRIQASLLALAIAWFLSGLALGIRVWDARACFLFFVWSVPFFAVGWILLGIPVIAMGTQILKHSRVVLGLSGAIAGFLVMLLPSTIIWMLTRGAEHFKLDWSFFKGWPGFGAVIGAGAMSSYRWLLSRAVSREATALSNRT
jgi:hypothetical protein